MPTMEVREQGSYKAGPIVKLSKEEVARLYMNGEIKTGSAADLRINGKAYTLNKMNDIEMGFLGYEPIRAWNIFSRDVLESKYGKPGELKTLMDEANQSFVPNLLEYQTTSGKQGTSFTLAFSPTKTMIPGKDGFDFTAVLLDQALNISNGDIYTQPTAGGGKPALLDTKTMDAIRSLLRSEANMEDYVSNPEYIPQGVNGKRTLRLTFSKAIASKSDLQIAGVNLSELSGKTFNIVLNDDAKGSAIEGLPNSTGYQIHDMIAKGKVFKMDPLIAASGFDATITPNVLSSKDGPSEQPTYVTVNLKFNERVNTRDPATGKMTTTMQAKTITQTINLIGQNAKSPDEIVNFLYSLYYENMVNNKTRFEEYKNYLQTAPTTTQGMAAPSSIQGVGNTATPTPARLDFNSRLKKMGLDHLAN